MASAWPVSSAGVPREAFFYTITILEGAPSKLCLGGGFVFGLNASARGKFEISSGGKVSIRQWRQNIFVTRIASLIYEDLKPRPSRAWTGHPPE
jgi:hypothetical protein